MGRAGIGVDRMTPMQKIALQQSENRTAIAALLENPERGDAERAELATLTKRGQALEIEYRAALLAQPDDTPIPTANTPAGREVRALLGRVEIEDYLSELIDAKPADSPARELRAAMLGEDKAGYFPLALIETRADAVSTGDAIPENQASIAARVFANGAADYLGVSFPTVPVGTQSFPRVTAGTTADVREPGVELDGTAFVITDVSASPARLTASYTLDEITAYRVQGYRGALRADLNRVMRDQMDSLVVNGQAAVTNVSPAVAGIINSLTAGDDPTDIAAAMDYLNTYTGAVDGKHASDDSAVRLLVNVATYQHAHGLQFGTSGDLLRDRLPAARFRASANMPDTASDIATAILYGASSPGRGLISPVWAGVQLIDDPYTGAKTGQRTITAVSYVGFVMADAAPYALAKFKLA